MDNNLLDLTSLLVDPDEVTSSSRPSTPSIFYERTKTSLAPVISFVETKADFKNAQFSRRQKKLIQKAERKEKKKIKKKKKKNSDNSVQDSNMQNDGVASGTVTKAPKKPIFDLAGNIITPAPSVPSLDKGSNGVSSTDSVTTKSPDSWLDKGPPLVLLTTKSPKSSSSTTQKPQEDVSTSTSSTAPSVSTTTKPSVTTNGFQDITVSSSTPSGLATGLEGTLKPNTPSPTQIDLTKDIQDKINLNLKNITSLNNTDSTQINIVINVVDKALAERRRRKWLRRQARRLKCPVEDFRNSPSGYKCCLKSAKCFENLPEDIDEVTEAGTQNVGPTIGNIPEACGQIDQSLVCMARVLAKDQCKSAAEIVNKDLNEELLMVQKFYKQHCPGNSAGGTTAPVPHIPGAGGQGQVAASGSESSLPTSALIGAAIGGLFFIILIVALVCFVRRKRSRPPTQDKVAFQSSPTTSARYKDFMRTNSDVYAEIDEKHLQRSFRVSNDTTTFEREEGSGGSTGSRPLPTAPSDGVYEDRAGYVTPRASRENLNDRAGYDALSAVSIDDENSAEPYDKLARNSEKPETEVTDGDYITPESGKPTEEKTPDNYHTYFVLEK